MRWAVVLLIGYLLLGLHLAVQPALAVGSPGAARIAPSLLIPFIVFIAMSGPLVPSLWVALVLGAVVDLHSPRGDGGHVVLGPYALGYLAGAYLVFTMRGMMMRRGILSIAFLSLIACVLAELVVVAMMSARAIFTPMDWSAGGQLLERLLSSVYTGLITGPVLGFILLRMSPLFGFQDAHARRFAARRP